MGGHGIRCMSSISLPKSPSPCDIPPAAPEKACSVPRPPACDRLCQTMSPSAAQHLCVLPQLIHHLPQHCKYSPRRSPPKSIATDKRLAIYIVKSKQPRQRVRRIYKSNQSLFLDVEAVVCPSASARRTAISALMTTYLGIVGTSSVYKL